MSKRSAEERRSPPRDRAVTPDPPPTPRERERVRKATDLVIQHRRKVLERLAER